MTHPVVLVHGAWHGTWCWERVITGLEAAGIPTYTVALHRGSVAADTAAVQEVIDKAVENTGKNVVVCGHSYAGGVISGLDTTHAASLIYLCGVLPEIGVSIAGTLSQSSPHLSAATVLSEDGRTVTLDPDQVCALFYNNCSEKDQAWARDLLLPQAVSSFFEPVRGIAWLERESTYVICTQDQVISPDSQRHMARHTAWIIEFDTDHSPFLSRPDLVVNLLIEKSRDKS